MMDFENAEQLRAYLMQRFGIALPAELRLKATKAHGIRVYSSALKQENVYGLEGFMAYSGNTGLNPHFVQLIGHLARKNILALKLKDAMKYAAGDTIRKPIKTEPGPVILAYKGHILGYGILEGKSILCPMRKKKRRELNDDIAAWPGRNL
jgi:NOL1/NOP2/fmu family ribosome biogenesis protein